jgi:hypothetical protein
MTWPAFGHSLWVLLGVVGCSSLLVSPIPPSDWRLVGISAVPSLGLQELGTVTISFGQEDFTVAEGVIHARTLCNSFGARYLHRPNNRLVVRLLPSTGVGCDSADMVFFEMLPHVDYYDLLPESLTLVTDKGDSLQFRRLRVLPHP